MKAYLKEWSKKTFGLIDLKIEEKKVEILNLDLIDDTFGLEEEEIIKRNQVSAELLRELHRKDGMLAQKAKAKWISVGDTNSRFFHQWISNRYKQNGIECLMVNNIWVDSVEGVKKKKVNLVERQTHIVGGRITLIQAVLSAVLIYCLSFYHLPKKSLREIVQIQRKFLWEGGEDNNKIMWVSWDNICKKKENGGLGIRNLENFNYALVSKWRVCGPWSLNLSMGELDLRVARHWGEVGVKSGWWKDVYEIFGDDEGEGMREECEIFVGNGNKTSFWLGRITDQQDAIISPMVFWGANGWHWDLKWRHDLRDRDMFSFNDLMSSLNRFQIDQSKKDAWRWSHANDGIFSTKRGY
ncbi:hypothetical protein ACS0TY_031126 [Phlomoides rotata]